MVAPTLSCGWWGSGSAGGSARSARSVTLIEHHVGGRACEEALRYARRLLSLAPWREGTHRQVMRLLAQQGHRGAALAQYRACCRALEEELGVAHRSPETVALRDRIRGSATTPPASVAGPTRGSQGPVARPG